MDKSSIGDWAFLHKAFPVLTSQQILQVLATFTPDEFVESLFSKKKSVFSNRVNSLS